MEMILNQLKNNLNGHLKLLIAYSGGIDSTVLLHQLTQLRKLNSQLQLRAIHINHGISHYANSWTQHCKQQCFKWKIPFSTISIKLDSKNKQDKGIEGASRIARYNALFKAVLPEEILLTAHHMDDQCETFFLALKRGSGPSGLSCMPLIRNTMEGKMLLRPFLMQERKNIEKWAYQHNLDWINDHSNEDTSFDRNFLRLKVLSVLKNKWPHFSKAVMRSAKICAYQEKLLRDFLTEILQDLTKSDGSLIIDHLYKYSEIKVYAIIRQWLINHNVIPSFKIIKSIWREIICSRKDASPSIKLGIYQIRRYRNAIYLVSIIPSMKEHILHWKFPWLPLKLPNKLGVVRKLHHSESEGMFIRCPNIGENVTIRFKAKGKFSILGRAAGHRLIKKLWQEFSIPPWLRERIPLIFYNEILIAALGIFVTKEGYTSTSNKNGWYLKLDQIS
ncbi:MAG: tRNA lysidine(34) synthetase TilS [Candidatus Dasytiphilus stammeri]